MPLYEYQCPQCGRFELIRKFSDEPLTSCPTCGKEIQKLPSAPAIQFKGSGWYVNDYPTKTKEKPAGGDGAPAPAAPAAATAPAGGDSGGSAKTAAKEGSSSGDSSK